MFTVTGSPVISSGTLTAALAVEASSAVLAGPSSGAAAAPTFRQLGTADIAGYVAPTTYYVFASTGLSASTSGASTWLTNTGVTSVGLSLPGMFTVTGSPVISSGTLTAALAVEASSAVLAGPSSGAAAAPTFRALTGTDISAACLPTVSTDPTSPTVGQEWFNSTTNTEKTRLANDGTNTLTGSVPHVLLTAGGQQVQCTTGAGSFTYPNFTLPAGFMNVLGRTLRVTVKLLTSFGVANSAAVFPFTLNNVLGCFGTTFTTSQEVSVTGYITTIATGSSGMVYFYATNTSPTGTVFTAGTTATINLTSTILVNNAFTCTASTSTDYITQNMLVVEKLG
jgi:hypothetical protein